MIWTKLVKRKNQKRLVNQIHKDLLDLFQAVDKVKQYFETKPDSNILVDIISDRGNAKALSSAIAHVKGMGNKAALLFAVDSVNNKISHACIVPKVMIFIFIL